MSHSLADVAVIGGSGLYSLLKDSEEYTVFTPHGHTSGPITVAEILGRTVAFLPRHGREHQFPPHKVPYRANMWALKAIGVKQIVAPCAVGSLRAEITPGMFAIPDQLVNFTHGREQTFYDEGANHCSFAEPYCPVGSRYARRIGAVRGLDVMPLVTMLVIDGPRFSTRAESRFYSSFASIINMTGYPEAILARELGMCYSSIALVTDMDAGVEGDSGVSHAEVMAMFGSNIEKMRGLLLDVVVDLPEETTCNCSEFYDSTPRSQKPWPIL